MKNIMISAAAITVSVLSATDARAQAYDAYIGEVRAFANAYCPIDWVSADGREIMVSENPALFSLIGCTYGGSCPTKFRVPDLQGRATLGHGASAQQSGLTNWTLGQKQGFEFTTTVPSHSHPLVAAATLSDEPSPVGNAIPSHDVIRPFDTQPSLLTGMASGAVQETGLAKVENRQPSLVVSYCIAIDGQYPSFD